MKRSTSQICDKINILEQKLARPYINRSLPLNARIEEISDWLKTEKELEILANAIWQEADYSIIQKLMIIIKEYL